MPRLSGPELIHNAAKQGAKTLAKPRGVRKRGGSWLTRVRESDRLRENIGKREIVKSFGSLSTREAYRLSVQERANIERQFEQDEVQLDLAKPILPPVASIPQTENQIAAAAKRYLRELEASARQVPIDVAGQEALREAIGAELFGVRQPNEVKDPTLQSVAEGLAAHIGLPLPPGAARTPFYEARRRLSASMNSFDLVRYRLCAKQILSSAEKCRRVCRRMSFTTRSAGAFSGDFFKEGWGFVFVPPSRRRRPNPP